MSSYNKTLKYIWLAFSEILKRKCVENFNAVFTSYHWNVALNVYRNWIFDLYIYIYNALQASGDLYAWISLFAIVKMTSYDCDVSPFILRSGDVIFVVSMRMRSA